MKQEIDAEEGILHHEEGIDILPGNIELSVMELTMANVMSRELIMREYVDLMRDRYDFIIIVCLRGLSVKADASGNRTAGRLKDIGNRNLKKLPVPFLFYIHIGI